MDKISSPTLVYSRRGEKYRTADNAALQAQYYSLQPNLSNRPKKRNKQFDYELYTYRKQEIYMTHYLKQYNNHFFVIICSVYLFIDNQGQTKQR